ncbi:MAG: hypothetical protein HY699_12225 [Deltaproteobacteria bacterium]|nr:hypothetical protein [Deltaproteobacteria bacterium]
MTARRLAQRGLGLAMAAGVLVPGLAHRAAGGDEHRPRWSVTAAVPAKRQKTIAWCWLAVAQMALDYFAVDDIPSQCRLMELGYGLANGYCCDDTARCTWPGSEQQIKAVIEHFGGLATSSREPPPNSKAIYDALSAGDLVIALIGAGFGQGHAVVVRGVRMEAEAGGYAPYLLVNDPLARVPEKIEFSKLREVWQRTIIVREH